MRLQSAVFTLEDTLFTPDGAAREGLDKALSLFKMEGVWLGAVTAMRAEDAQRALDRAGLSSYFRFVLTESVALCGVYSGTMFERAMKRLHARKEDTVVFSGTPCQVAGLKTFLGKDDSQLLTGDIVCHGTPSPLLLERYVEWQEQKYGSRIRSVRFRNKTYGYHSGTMKLEFENGRTYYGSARVDLFLRSFFSDLCSRPSCYDCRFKQARHVSDLTLFDAWHAAELNAAVRDDDRGYTNIFVQSERGRALLEAVRHTMELYETDAGQAIALDGVMVRSSVRWNDKREVFFLGLMDEPLDRHCKKFFHITWKDRLIERAKRIYYFRKMRAALKDSRDPRS